MPINIINQTKKLIMKRILLFTIVTFFYLGVYLSAQGSPWTFGVKAGANVSTSSFKPDMDSNKKSKMGFNIGLTAEYELAKSFFLQSGIAFTTKGIKAKGESIWIGGQPVSTLWEQSINQSYLQIPITAAYKISIARNTQILIHAGPYFAYGIGGSSDSKYIYTGGISGEPGENKDTFNKAGLKRMDLGLIGGLGLEYCKFVLAVDYELGLTDLSHSDTRFIYAHNNINYKNRNVSMSIGYKF